MGRYLVPILTAVLLASAASAHTDITAGVARTMILTDENLVVLDVREYSEFCGSTEHIEDAADLPWIAGVLQSRFDELPADAKILVICASGGRSHQAATFLDGEGFANVYDIQGGMSAWEWETEACGAAPVVSLHKNTQGSAINWTPVHDLQDYDLIRGVVDNIADAGFFTDLGPTDCLTESSVLTYHTDPDLPQSVYFYLARQVQGSWGASSNHEVRHPVLIGCDGGLD